MKAIILTLILSSCIKNSCNSQGASSNLLDSIAYLVLKEDTEYRSLYASIDWKYCYADAYVSKAYSRILPVIDAQRCKDSPKTFFTVSVNGTTYIISSSQVINPDKTITKLDSLKRTYPKNFDYKNFVNQNSALFTEADINYRINKLKPELKRLSEIGIGIVDWSWDKVYEKFIGIQLSLVNTSKKVITSVEITFTALSENNTAVNDEITRNKIGKVKCLGPIMANSIVTCSFNSAFTSSIVNSIKLNGIKITYGDGQVKIIQEVSKAICSYELTELYEM